MKTLKRLVMMMAVLTPAVLSAQPTDAEEVSSEATHFPVAEDVATPEAIVTAAYESIMRAPGERYDWDRFRSLFLPQANLIPNTEQSGGKFTVLSPEDFIARVDPGTNVGGPNDRGFAEEAVHNVVEEYGDIAHVFSHYQKHFWDDAQILGRGINTFQLVRNEGRWWIVGIAWDEETGAGPIPSRYRGETADG